LKSLAILEEAGIEVITDIDKGPFIEATAPVREKYGSEFSEILKRAEAVGG
jgi:hypothetical protein